MYKLILTIVVLLILLLPFLLLNKKAEAKDCFFDVSGDRCLITNGRVSSN
jgi:hypothetical protein